MKKIFSILTVALLGLASWSCAERELTPVYAPENAVPPVLQEIGTDYTLAEGETFDTFSFVPADFGVAVSVKYTMSVDLAGNGFANAKTLENTTSPSTQIAVDAAKLNNALLSLGVAPNTPTEVQFRVTAEWMGESSSVGIKLISNAVKTTITGYNAEKEYAKVYVLGSFNGWSHAKALYLFNYAEDDVNFEGVIDFGEDHAANAFKITGADSWDNATGNWGQTGAPAPEAGQVQLLNASNDNIAVYTAKRYYRFAFNKSTLMLSLRNSFDKVGVIGDFNSWGDDKLMEYSAAKQLFYTDVEFATATSFKFRLDADWAVNWGGADGVAEQGGANIPCDAGNYRIYLDLNSKNIIYRISAEAYGTEEGGGEEEPVDPVVENAWSLIGEVNGANWDKDVYMTEKDGVWSSNVVTLKSQFKIRFNNDWAENVGGTLVNLGEPFAAVAGGDNIVVPAEGVYKVIYNTNDQTITVFSYADHWSLIGEIAGTSWDTDFFMEKTGEGLWKSPAVVIDGGFKLRYNTSWDLNKGGVLVNLGEPFAAVDGGDNITVPATGKEYFVTYNENDQTIMVEAALPSNQWSLIGQLAGSGWDKDFYMTLTASGLWVSDPVTVDGEFKLRFNNDWGVNRGGTLVALGENFAVTQDGANIAVPATGVAYQVIYNPALETVTVLSTVESWSLIGQIEGSGWDKDFFLRLTPSGKWVSNPVKINGEFKLRFGGNWDTNRGGTVVAMDEAFAVENGGANMAAPKNDNLYIVEYDPATETVTVEGCWSLIGLVNGANWDKDIYMVKTAEDVWEGAAVADGEFKLRYNSDWGVNRGGALANLGEAFAVTQDGANIAVPSIGVKYRVTYSEADQTVTVTAM